MHDTYKQCTVFNEIKRKCACSYNHHHRFQREIYPTHTKRKKEQISRMNIYLINRHDKDFHLGHKFFQVHVNHVIRPALVSP